MKPNVFLPLIAALGATFFSSCASGGGKYQDSSSSYAPKPGKGMVIAYWSHGFAGAAATMNIFANGKEIAHAMGRGQYVAYDADPGPLSLATRGQLNPVTAVAAVVIAAPTAGLSLAGAAVDASVKIKSKDLDVVAGETYFMRFGPSGMLQKFKPVTREKAEKEIATCRSAPPPKH